MFVLSILILSILENFKNVKIIRLVGRCLYNIKIGVNNIMFILFIVNIFSKLFIKNFNLKPESKSFIFCLILFHLIIHKILNISNSGINN